MNPSVQFSSAQSCPALCHPMDCSTPGLPVHHQLKLMSIESVMPSNHLGSVYWLNWINSESSQMPEDRDTTDPSGWCILRSWTKDMRKWGQGSRRVTQVPRMREIPEKGVSPRGGSLWLQDQGVEDAHSSPFLKACPRVHWVTEGWTATFTEDLSLKKDLEGSQQSPSTGSRRRSGIGDKGGGEWRLLFPFIL